MRNKIVWLASYPKSGNTWFRIFLSAIQDESDACPDINDLYSSPLASSRDIFDEHAGIESSDLTADEADRLRPEVYQCLARTLEERLFMKTHDAFTKTSSGDWMFPPEVTWGVIYLVRNPLDIAVSYANHNGQSIERIVENLCDKEHCLAQNKKGFPDQLRQILTDWSGHVLSWLDSGNSICILRYEDMKSKGFATFKRAVQFLELDKSDAQIRDAIKKSNFESLQNQEKENSFNEKPQHTNAFFRKGVVGDWREHLNDRQVDKLIKAHYGVMKRLKYLDDKDQLTI